MVMAPIETEDSSETNRLLRRAADGDGESWGALLTRHEDRLRRMVAFRLDPRLQGRIDPSDVIQEAYLAASEHLAEYLRRPAMPFFLWLRGPRRPTSCCELHRHHLGHADARRRPRGLALPRRPARGDLRRPGRPAPGPRRPGPARPPSGPSRRSASRRRSTAWTRSTARSWPCGTSSS